MTTRFVRDRGLTAPGAGFGPILAWSAVGETDR